MSDDSPALSPTMYNKIFTWVETRAKSELRMRLLPLNMLKLSRIFGSVVDDFLFIVTPIVESVIFLCFVVRYFMTILVLQSS